MPPRPRRPAPRWSSTRRATSAPSSAAAEEAGVDIVAVADTHVHNDYVSGALGAGPPARRRLPARPPTSRSHFERVGVRDGDVLTSAGSSVEVLATPGPHPPPPVLPGPRAPADGRPRCSAAAACCTAPSAAPTSSTRGWRCDLAGAQWASARAARRARRPTTRLLPTHGFGSFCAGTHRRTADGDGPATDRRPADDQPGPAHGPGPRSSTSWSPASGPIPAYYAHMDPLNRAGAGHAARPGPPGHRRRGHRRDRWPALGGRPARPRDVTPTATCRARSAWSTPPSSRRTSAGWCRGTPSSCCSPTDPADLGAGAPRPGRHRHRRASAPTCSTPAAPLDGDATAAPTGPASAQRDRTAGRRRRPPARRVRRPATCPAPCTCPSTRSSVAATRCPPASSGCTAGPATAPASPPACCTGPAARVVHVDDAWDRVAELAIPTTPGGRLTRDPTQRCTATPTHSDTSIVTTHHCAAHGGRYLGKVERCTCPRHLSPDGTRRRRRRRRRRRSSPALLGCSVATARPAPADRRRPRAAGRRRRLRRSPR